ncbi:MAG: helix-turn-helix transcriptional regulator [Lachnospiraceae bacterium]|nr:helix-turn-helix transcriptional regulator [Lachnospiraceae bacterium]
MKIISFRDMYQMDYTAKQLFAMNQNWRNRQSFRMSVPRKTSALFYCRNCSVTYDIGEDKQLYAKQGSLVYLPQGSQYTANFHNCKESSVHAQLLEFELIDNDGYAFSATEQVSLVKNIYIQNCPDIFDELASIFISPFYSHSLMKSKVYSILYEISRYYHHEIIYSKSYMHIAKGILYLENDTSHKLSIEEIAKMCHVNESCFRRLFKQYSGISPSEYRMQNIVRQAKALLRSGDMTVSEIAVRLGYDDPAYFSRIFKKKTGVTPSEYAQHVFRLSNKSQEGISH